MPYLPALQVFRYGGLHFIISKILHSSLVKLGFDGVEIDSIAHMADQLEVGQQVDGDGGHHGQSCDAFGTGDVSGIDGVIDSEQAAEHGQAAEYQRDDQIRYGCELRRHGDPVRVVIVEVQLLMRSVAAVLHQHGVADGEARSDRCGQ